MLKLGRNKEKRWLDLGDGLRVHVRPLTTHVYRAATATALRKSLAMAEERGLIEEAGGTVADLPTSVTKEDIEGLRTQFMLQALAVHAIAEWEGIGAPDGDGPAPLTEENVCAFIREFPVHASRFETAYLYSLAQVDAEGNA